MRMIYQLPAVDLAPPPIMEDWVQAAAMQERTGDEEARRLIKNVLVPYVQQSKQRLIVHVEAEGTAWTQSSMIESSSVLTSTRVWAKLFRRLWRLA